MATINEWLATCEQELAELSTSKDAKPSALKAVKEQAENVRRLLNIYDGDWCICDDCGVVFDPAVNEYDDVCDDCADEYEDDWENEL